MTRITMTFDVFMSDLTLWLSDAWILWVSMPLVIVLVIATRAIMKQRQRSRAHIPHYRRSGG
ncbi:MAG: hypothetical protein ACRCSP_01420 [Rhodoglobus sp.]